MKLFCLLQKHFKIWGIHNQQSFETSNTFNLRNSLSLTYLLLFSIMAGINFIFETKTMKDISNGIQSFSTPFATAFNMAIIILQSSNIFSLIESIETLVQTRKRLEIKRNWNLLNEILWYFTLLGLENESENEDENKTTRTIYEKANATIEKWTTKISYIVSASLIPAIIINLVYTLSTYFIKGLDKDDYVDFMYSIW